MSDHWSQGGAGAVELGEAVIAACQEPPLEFKFLYPAEASIKVCRPPSPSHLLCSPPPRPFYGGTAPRSYFHSRSLPSLVPPLVFLQEKLDTIVKEMYGGDGVEYTETAEEQIKAYEAAGYGHLPLCVAKTQYSLSCDAAAKGMDALALLPHSPFHFPSPLFCLATCFTYLSP